MTTIAFPVLTAKPTQYAFGQNNNSALNTSPMSGSTQTIEMPGARWTLAIGYINVISPDRGRLSAFLAAMRGMANRVALYDIVHSIPAGTMRGTITTVGVTAAGAISVALTAGSGQAGTTLLMGDKLNIGGELKMVVADATADGSGNVTVTIEPPMRNQVAGGASVVWNQPTALFMLTSPKWKEDVALGDWTSYTIDLVESFS